jgi:histidinol dehydrogenase
VAQVLDAGAADFDQRFDRLIRASREEKTDVDAQVAGILADISARGDAAVIDYSRRWDKLDLTAATLRFAAADIERAESAADPDALAAINTAAARIADYHRRQMPHDEFYTDADGIGLGWRWTPVTSAGLYVPGGTAALFSSVLMNAIPAKIAGVARLVVTMPTPGGATNPLMLAACRIAGVDEVYRIGGAQAIGALAYGTATIAAVDKIVGPGNAYVASAKKQVFGTVGIDMIAGPSEVTVVADAANDPDWIAADLLAQAEHDASSQSILITDDRAFADRVAAAIERALATLPRAAIARAAWTKNGVIVIVGQIADAAALVDRIAPEHLELAVADPRALAARIRHAGAIFLGRHSPEVVGDYIAGPSHVLPTSGTARFSSGLSVFDFLKRTSLIECSPAGLSAVAGATVAMARAEELDAHARSVTVRTNRGPGT